MFYFVCHTIIENELQLIYWKISKTKLRGDLAETIGNLWEVRPPQLRTSSVLISYYCRKDGEKSKMERFTIGFHIYLIFYVQYFLKGGKGSRVEDLVVKWIKKLRSLKKTGENFLLLFDNAVDGRPENLLYCKGGIDCFRRNVSDQDELISARHVASL